MRVCNWHVWLGPVPASEPPLHHFAPQRLGILDLYHVLNHCIRILFFWFVADVPDLGCGGPYHRNTCSGLYGTPLCWASSTYRTPCTMWPLSCKSLSGNCVVAVRLGDQCCCGSSCHSSPVLVRQTGYLVLLEHANCPACGVKQGPPLPMHLSVWRVLYVLWPCQTEYAQCALVPYRAILLDMGLPFPRMPQRNADCICT